MTADDGDFEYLIGGATRYDNTGTNDEPDYTVSPNGQFELDSHGYSFTCYSDYTANVSIREAYGPQVDTTIYTVYSAVSCTSSNQVGSFDFTQPRTGPNGCTILGLPSVSNMIGNDAILQAISAKLIDIWRSNSSGSGCGG